MKRPSLDLSNGITLEISSITIPWQTSFHDLPAIGHPEVRQQKDREVLVWKNEQVLNGIRVDLSAVYEKNASRSAKLTSLTAYLCESSFQSACELLESQFKAPRYKKLNDIEYTYTWKTGKCDVVLSHLDRFGSYFRLEVKFRPGFAPITMIKSTFSRLFNRKTNSFDGFNFNAVPLLKPVVLTHHPVYI